MTELSVDTFREFAAKIENEVGRVIVGQEEVVRHVLVSILAGGHVLLEGVPGLGKTMLIRTLGQVMDMTTALDFNEVYTDPKSGIAAYARAGGFAPRAADAKARVSSRIWPSSCWRPRRVARA